MQSLGKFRLNVSRILGGVATGLMLVGVACGAAATAIPAPTASRAPGATAALLPTPTATPQPAKVTSAKDNVTLAVSIEPDRLNSLRGITGSLISPIIHDNVVETLTWQSGDDQRIVPTSATVSWEQLAPDKWRFQLRNGIKFHNGESWNAQAALPSLDYQGISAKGSKSFPYTAGFKSEAVGADSLDIICEQPCPVFPNTAFFLSFEAPNFVNTTPEAELARQSIGFGPYKVVKWDPGVSITEAAYSDYVPAGNHPEFQKPLLRNVKWVFRGDSTVLAAMVKAGEADIAWDVGVDTVKALPKEMIKSGSSAEVFVFWVDNVWHPELKKKQVRLAINHAINCQEIVDTLYGGYSTCRGNIIFPGVIGATERNTAPFEYNPARARELLREANYDPKNEIRITGRAARIPKNVEVYEAVQGYLKQVGMNVKISIVEQGTYKNISDCGVGVRVNEYLEAQGKDPNKVKPALADIQEAIGKGPPTKCVAEHMVESEPSNETLDFGRQVNFKINCAFPRSHACDPSPGGIQEQIAPALAASGAERQRLMSVLADKMHDDALSIFGFDLPVIYAVNPKLNWKTRFDGRVRVNTMWFSK